MMLNVWQSKPVLPAPDTSLLTSDTRDYICFDPSLGPGLTP